jgi:hypothetical protein
MIHNEWIRREGFWAVDFLKGSKVRKYYVDVKYIMGNGVNPNVPNVRMLGGIP